MKAVWYNGRKNVVFRLENQNLDAEWGESRMTVLFNSWHRRLILYI